MKALIIILILLCIILLACSGCIEDDGPRARKGIAFLKAIEETHQPQQAWELLTKETQEKIKPEQLFSENGDFKPIIDAFRQANITDPPQKSRKNPWRVSQLGGKRGTLTFIMIREDGDWKIANIIDDTKNYEKYYHSIEDEESLVHKANTFLEFFEAIEKTHQPQQAWELLTKETQEKIKPEQLFSENGDFKPIVDAFRQANITDPPQKSHKDSWHVSQLGGKEGTLTFIMIREDGDWKIANIIDDTKKYEKYYDGTILKKEDLPWPVDESYSH